MNLTTNGIVLRDYKLEENRILTILTEDMGVLTAFANGANRTKSRLAPTTELLCYSHFVLFRSKDRFTVDKADSNRIFFGIREDLDKLALASYLAELTLELAPAGEPAGEYLRLLLNALHYIETGKRDAAFLKPLAELRLLTLAGYMPNLVACRECAVYEAPVMYFSPRQGEMLCGSCGAGRSLEGTLPLMPGVLAAMRHIIYSPPQKLFAFSLSTPESLEALGAVSEYYLQYQVEKTFSSLEFYNSLRRSSHLPAPAAKPDIPAQEHT